MGFVLLIIEYFIPVLVIIYCYASIIHMLSARINNDQLSSGQDVNSTNNRLQQAKRNTLITLTFVAGAFVICWSQSQFLYLLYNLGFDIDFHGTYFFIAILIAILNCTINPFIYMFKYRDCQVALKEFCNCWFGRRNGLKLSPNCTYEPMSEKIHSVIYMCSLQEGQLQQLSIVQNTLQKCQRPPNMRPEPVNLWKGFNSFQNWNICQLKMIKQASFCVFHKHEFKC